MWRPRDQDVLKNFAESGKATLVSSPTSICLCACYAVSDTNVVHSMMCGRVRYKRRVWCYVVAGTTTQERIVCQWLQYYGPYRGSVWCYQVAGTDVAYGLSLIHISEPTRPRLI
eukprot:1721581-Rhodomonas_salina.1